MKVAVSIPDAIFAEAEALAQHFRSSRSELYARALKEFVATHGPDRVTASWNAVIDEGGHEVDEWTNAAARKVFERSEW